MASRIKLEGSKIGKLTIVDYLGFVKKRAWYKCVCDCGNVFNRRSDLLSKGVDRCTPDCILGNKPRVDKGSKRKPEAWGKYECPICNKKFNKLKCISGDKFVFCSIECKNKGIKLWTKGELNHAYIKDRNELKDVRQSIEGNQWRLSVFKRDDYKCTCCGEYGKIHAHHLKSFTRFPELRFDVDNGTTLCEDCHRLFHSEYGVRSFTSDDYYEFIKERGVE